MSVICDRLRAIPLKHANLSHGRISYRDFGAGDPVLCLHGVSSSSGSWLMQFETLSDRYRLIAWDAPGYGESTPLQGDAPSMEKYERVLREFLHSLNLSKFHLVVHSLGALFAAAYCQEDAVLPQSLTFISPTLGYGGLQREEREKKVNYRIQLFKELGAKQYALERAPKLLSENASEEAQEIVRWNMNRLRERGYFQAVRLLGSSDLLRLAGGVAIPVLVLCGTADEITPEPVARKVQAAYSHAEYHSLEGCGHAAQVEAWELVNQRLLMNFSKTSAGESCSSEKNVRGQR